MQRLQGKVAIVTGAGSGIGQGIAKRLGARAPRSLSTMWASRDGAEETARAIRPCGRRGRNRSGRCDQHGRRARTWWTTAWTRFGSADILVNNAGMEKKSAFWDTTEDRLRQSDGSESAGPFLPLPGFRAAPARRKEARHGSSISAPSTRTWYFPGFSTYCCSKGGLRMLMRDLAVELGPLGHHGQQCCSGRHSDTDQQVAARKQDRARCVAGQYSSWAARHTRGRCRRWSLSLLPTTRAYITGSTFVDRRRPDAKLP